MKKEQKSFEVRINVPFFDLDPMQIVWHGNYLNYFEIARAALFDHYGVDLYSYYEREKIMPIYYKQKEKYFSHGISHLQEGTGPLPF